MESIELKTQTVVNEISSNLDNEQKSSVNVVSNLLKNNVMENKVTKTAVIDGKEKVITPLFPADYLMVQPKDKTGILPGLEMKNFLPVMYNLARPDCFIKEGVPLVDINGNPVPSLDGLENPFVVCQTADTYWRLPLEIRLENVRVHEFESVRDYFKSIGCTMLYSRGLSALELTGVAGQASGNETYKAIYDFARKNDLNQSSASLYLGVKLKKEQTLQLSVGNNELSVPKLERTEEQAQALFDAVEGCLGKGGAKNRYGIQVANYFDKHYGLEITIAAFKLVPASAITMYKLMGCGEKVSCLTEILSTYVKMVAAEFQKQAA